MSRRLPVFYSPVRIQRANGLGNVVGRLFRFVVPFFSRPTVRKNLSSIGSAALSAASQALADPNVNFKTALKESGKRELKRIIDQAASDYASAEGSGIKKRRIILPDAYRLVINSRNKKKKKKTAKKISHSSF
jgi:hypothetical protein